MKQAYIILLTTTFFSFPFNTISATELNKDIPQEFQNYFYNSEIPAQIYVNDINMLDAFISLERNGKIKLINIIKYNDNVGESVNREQWVSALREGIDTGECTTTCPAGLMKAEYDLNSSALKLYSRNYESDRHFGDYVRLPQKMSSGAILHNDFTLSRSGGSSSYQNWRLNSGLTSSLFNWTQQVSFLSTASTGTYQDDYSELFEMYTQKEAEGNFYRIGFFSPDTNAGNVSLKEFVNDSVIGLMWGTSDALLVSAETVSAWPVYVTGRNQSIAEVWRDGRLIYTQQLAAGVQALDTRRLPSGIYDVTVNVIENGQIVDTQISGIFKPVNWMNPDKKYRGNLWGGQLRKFATTNYYGDMQNKLAIGGSIDLLLHPQFTLGLSGNMSEEKYSWRSRAEFTPTSKSLFFAQISSGKEQNRNIEVRYTRDFGFSTMGLSWQNTVIDYYHKKDDLYERRRRDGNTWGLNASLRFAWDTRITLNTQYFDSVYRHGWGNDIGINTRRTLWGRDMNFRITGYDRPGFNGGGRDQGVAMNVTLSLAPKLPHHSVSAELGMNDGQGYSNMSYQWNPEDSGVISYMGTGVSYSRDNTVFSGQGGINHRYIDGDVFAQYGTQSHSTAVGANLSQSIAIGGGSVAVGSSNHDMQAALIVNFESPDEKSTVIASGGRADVMLKPGRNIVPVDHWRAGVIQFSPQGSEAMQIWPQREEIYMNKGSVKTVNIKAARTRTLVGVLKSTSGELLRNREIHSEVARGMINADGVVTLDVTLAEKYLYIDGDKNQPRLACRLPAQRQDDSKKVLFMDNIVCHTQAGV